MPVSHRGSLLLWGRLCSQADVGDGWKGREETQTLLSSQSCARFPHCRGIYPGETWPVPAAAGGAEGLHQRGRGWGVCPACHSTCSPCRKAASLLALRLEPARTFRDAGCWLRAVPGLMALPPARSAFESPCPEPGSGAGEDGQITSSWSRLPPHVVCLVGHCKPRASGHALPFHLCLRAVQEPRWSEIGPGPLELPVTLPRASLALCQGAMWCSGACGCLAGPLAPQLPKGLGEDVFVPQSLQSCLPSCPGHLECVGERGTGATGVSGEGELEASREHGV